MTNRLWHTGYARRLVIAGFLVLFLLLPIQHAAASLLSANGSFDSAVQLGTENDENGYLYVAPSGDRYIRGTFQGTVDFDPGPGQDLYTSNGGTDVYFSSYSENGAYQWTRTLGGTGADAVRALTVDTAGVLYIAGTFRGTVDFDPGPGQDLYTSNGGEEAFFSRYNSDGSYSLTRSLGGTGNDAFTSVVFDSQNNVYIGGYYQYVTDLNPEPISTETHNAGNSPNAVLLKYDANGNYVFNRWFGSNNRDDRIAAMTVDDNDNIYVAHSFSLTVDFDPGPGVATRTSKGSTDAYVAKFDNDGAFVWVQAFGSSDGIDSVQSLLIVKDQLYVSGAFDGSSIDFDPGPGTDVRTNNGAVGTRDGYIVRYDLNGNYYGAHSFGGVGNDYVVLTMVDEQIVAHGNFNNVVDFDPGPGTDVRTSAGLTDGFAAYYDSELKYQGVWTFGGIGADALGSVYSVNGQILISGSFSDTIVLGPVMLASAGGTDVFVARYALSVPGANSGLYPSAVPSTPSTGLIPSIDTAIILVVTGLTTGIVYLLLRRRMLLTR